MSFQWKYPPETVRDHHLRLVLHGRVHGELGFPNLPPLPQPPLQIPHRIPMRNDASSPVPNVRSRDSQGSVPIACVPRCSDSSACYRKDVGSFPTPHVSQSEWKNWYIDDALFIICGAVSGNLLVFDFDQQGKVYEDFKAQVPTELFDRLVVETSQSGGKHVIIRLDCPIGKGNKIAVDENKNVLIETRGEGQGMHLFLYHSWETAAHQRCSVVVTMHRFFGHWKRFQFQKIIMAMLLKRYVSSLSMILVVNG